MSRWSCRTVARNERATPSFSAARPVHQNRVLLIDAARDLGIPPSAEDRSGAGVGIHPGQSPQRPVRSSGPILSGLNIVEKEGTSGFTEPSLLTAEYQGAELEPGVHIGKEGWEVCAETPVLEVEQSAQASAGRNRP